MEWSLLQIIPVDVSLVAIVSSPLGKGYTYEDLHDTRGNRMTSSIERLTILYIATIKLDLKCSPLHRKYTS